MSILALYSDDPSLNLTEVYDFSVIIAIEKNKKQKGPSIIKDENYFILKNSSTYFLSGIG